MIDPRDLNDDDMAKALERYADSGDLPAGVAELLRAASERIAELSSFVLEMGEQE